jgi:hypothetical protein
MKIHIFVFAMLLSVCCFGQEESQTITETLTDGQTSNRQSQKKILTRTQLATTTKADYKSSRAITLTPGFVAEKGSTFKATITAIADDAVQGELAMRASPNPFDKHFVLEYNLFDDADVTLTMVNLQGKIIKTVLNNEVQTKGAYKMEIDGSELLTGEYIVVFRTPFQKHSIKVVKF